MLEPLRHLERPPEIIWGATQKEVLIILGLAFAITVPSCLFLFLLLGVGALGHVILPAAGISIFVLLWIGCRMLQQFKRGRPDYYFSWRLQLFWIQWGLKKDVFTLYDGSMHLRR